MAQYWLGTPISEVEPAVQQQGQQWPGIPIDQSAENSVSGLAEGFLGGVNRGIAGVVGAPVDLVNAGLNVAGLGSQYPIGGSESIRDAMDATLGRVKSDGTMFSEGPDTTTGNIVNRVGQELGATTIPGAGLIGAGMRAAAPAVKQAPTMARTFLEPIGRSPGRAAAAEAAAATSAGAAAGVAQEAAPWHTGFEMAAQVAGGLAPTALANAPTALAAKMGQGLWKRFSPEAQRRAACETVRDHVEDELVSPRAREELDRSQQLTQEIPNFNLSLAERAGAQGLIRKQEDIESKLSGADLDAAVARRTVNEGQSETTPISRHRPLQVSPRSWSTPPSARSMTSGAALTAKPSASLMAGTASPDDCRTPMLPARVPGSARPAGQAGRRAGGMDNSGARGRSGRPHIYRSLSGLSQFPDRGVQLAI